MSDRGERNRQLLEVSALGIMFPLAIGIGYGWGWWMDRTFGTYPWLTIIFTAMGVAAGFINLFRAALRDDGKSGSESGGDDSSGGAGGA